MNVYISFSKFEEEMGNLGATFSHRGLCTLYDHLLEIHGYEHVFELEEIAESYYEIDPMFKVVTEEEYPAFCDSLIAVFYTREGKKMFLMKTS